MASISHIAHLTVTTKTAESSCAWRAYYQDGKLAPLKPGQSIEPKPIAGRLGTQITVEDLFYNVPQRKRAFKSPSDEYAKIMDVVGRYAIHRTGIAFSCKKHGEPATSISISAASGIVDRIKQIQSAQVGNELIHFNFEDDRLGFKVEGWATNANYSIKKTTLMLFINHRLVDSAAVKNAIQKIYSVFLPKGGHPWAYLSLEIDPKNLDVNVHPTKREVKFLNEDEIIEAICDAITTELSKVDASRAFLTQSLMPGMKIPSANIIISKSSGSTSQQPRQHASQSSRPYENNMVRTDPNARKITSMLSKPDRDNSSPSSTQLEYESDGRIYCASQLSSIKKLKTEVRESRHDQLTDIFATHTFVGIVDISRRLAAIQSGVNLCLVDYGMLSRELFYQIGLTDFENFGTIALETPLDIRSLVKIAADAEQALSDEDLSSAPERICELLVSRRVMLHDYFSMDVSEAGILKGLPLLMKGYLPAFAKLPRFLLRLGPCVKWDEEKDCFETFLKELAKFYEPEQIPNSTISSTRKEIDLTGDSEDMEEDVVEDAELTSRRTQLSQMIEHVLFPAFKSQLEGTSGLKSAVRQMTDLKSLYRVFERC